MESPEALVRGGMPENTPWATSVFQKQPLPPLLQVREVVATSDEGKELLIHEKKQSRTREPESERIFGLVQQYPDPRDQASTANASIDIIVLHGLGAHSPKTWLAFKNGRDASDGMVNWLKDRHMLPHKMPDSRIITYDWNANYKQGASQDRLLGHADKLLDLLDINRESTGRSDRPIIFLASCFGGLLLARALLRATEPYHFKHGRYRHILQCTVGAAFLGTPFRGSWEVGFANAQVRYGMAALEGQECSPELFQYLRPDRRHDDDGRPSPLDDMVENFAKLVRNHSFNFPVSCFYETRVTPVSSLVAGVSDAELKKAGIYKEIKKLTVPQRSACLDGADHISMEVRHNMLHKHASPDSVGFLQIVDRLKIFAEGADETLRKKNNSHVPIMPSERLAEWLTCPDYTTKHNDILPTWQPGTLDAFLLSHDFVKWKTESSPQPILCLGMPGAGKTVLASRIIDDLSKLPPSFKRTAVAYVYCDYLLHDEKQPRQQQQTAENIVASILKQLIRSCALVPKPVQVMFKTLRQEERQPSVTEAVEAIYHIARSISKAFLVVDGLDECRQVVWEMLVGELLELQKKASNVCLFFTSGFNPKIEARFRAGSVLKTIHARKKDIALYIKESHQLNLSNIRSSERRKELEDEIVNTITEQSDGMFLLAQMFLTMFQHQVKERDIQSTIHSLHDLRAGHHNCTISAMLFAVSSRWIDRIDRQNSTAKKVAKKAFTWLTFAETPLTPDQLQQAVAIKADEYCEDDLHPSELDPQEDIVSSCAGLVHVSDTNAYASIGPVNARKEVRFVHYVIKEILRSHSPYILGRETVITQLHLAKLCITYMSLDTFEAGPCASEKLLISRLRRWPFYEYAVKNWGLHVGHVLRQSQKQKQSHGLEQDNNLDFLFTFLCDEEKVASASQAQNYLSLLQRKSEHPSCTPSIDKTIATTFQTLDQEGHQRWGTGLHLAASFPGLSGIVDALLPPHTIPLTGVGQPNPNLATDEAESRHSYAAQLDELSLTPLHHAASIGDTDTITCLIRYYTTNNNTNHHTEHGQQQQPTSQEKKPHLISALLTHRGGGAQEHSPHGYTPLQLASLNGHRTAVQCLLYHENDVNNESELKPGSSSYHRSGTTTSTSARRTIMRQNNRNEALFLAAAKGHKSVVQLLLSDVGGGGGADPNFSTTTSFSCTATNSCSEQKQDEQGEEAVKVKKSASEVSKENGHLDVVELLASYISLQKQKQKKRDLLGEEEEGDVDEEEDEDDEDEDDSDDIWDDDNDDDGNSHQLGDQGEEYEEDEYGGEEEDEYGGEEEEEEEEEEDGYVDDVDDGEEVEQGDDKDSEKEEEDEVD